MRQADVEAASFDHQAKETVFLAQAVQGRGELELAALAHVVGQVLFRVVENQWLDDVLPEDGQILVFRQPGHAQVGARVIQRRLFCEFGNAQQSLLLEPDAGHGTEVGDLVAGS